MSRELKEQRITVYKEAIESKVERLEVMADKIYMKNKLIEESKAFFSRYVIEKEILENEIDYLKKYLKSLKVNS
mgnify:CR=1 FL=1